MIRRADFEGLNIEDLVDGWGVIMPDLELDVKRGKMYWVSGSLNRIRRADLDGKNVQEVIINIEGQPGGLALGP